MLFASFADWTALVEQAIEGTRQGWPQVERMLRAAFTFFEDHPDFVRLVRWEALEGGPILRDELSVLLRPLFDRGADFLEREMDAGRLRRYDARQLLLTGYGAVLSYLSDGQLMTGLLDVDPLSAEALAIRREHVIDVLRIANRATRRAATASPAESFPSLQRSSSDASPNTSTRSAGRPHIVKRRSLALPRAATSAFRVLVHDRDAVRAEPYQPLAVAVGAMQMHRLALPGRRPTGPERQDVEQLLDAVDGEVSVDRRGVPDANSASHRCTASSFACRRDQKPTVR